MCKALEDMRKESQDEDFEHQTERKFDSGGAGSADRRDSPGCLQVGARSEPAGCSRTKNEKTKTLSGTGQSPSAYLNRKDMQRVFLCH